MSIRCTQALDRGSKLRHEHADHDHAEHRSELASREARVLLVDDDRELCQMLTEYLDAEHFDVKSVHDGGDALAELQANEFEILILDVMLPSVGGFDVLRKLGASYDDAHPHAHGARR